MWALRRRASPDGASRWPHLAAVVAFGVLGSGCTLYSSTFGVASLDGGTVKFALKSGMSQELSNVYFGSCNANFGCYSRAAAGAWSIASSFRRPTAAGRRPGLAPVVLAKGRPLVSRVELSRPSQGPDGAAAVREPAGGVVQGVTTPAPVRHFRVSRIFRSHTAAPITQHGRARVRRRGSPTGLSNRHRSTSSGSVRFWPGICGRPSDQESTAGLIGCLRHPDMRSYKVSHVDELGRIDDAAHTLTILVPTR